MSYSVAVASALTTLNRTVATSSCAPSAASLMIPRLHAPRIHLSAPCATPTATSRAHHRARNIRKPWLGKLSALVPLRLIDTLLFLHQALRKDTGHPDRLRTHPETDLPVGPPRNELPPPPPHHPFCLQPPAARTLAPQPAGSSQRPTAPTVGSAPDVSSKSYSAALSGAPAPQPANPPPAFPNLHHPACTDGSIRPVESVLKDFLASITACPDIVRSTVQLLQVTSELIVALRTNTNRVAGLRLVSRFLTINLFGIHG